MSGARAHGGPGALERRLLAGWQRDFPLTARPYAAIARALGTTEAEVLAAFTRLTAAGAVARIGATVRPRALGASTLAAMAVPQECLERVAAVVSACAGVNHNYEREHALNLWFVAAARDEAALAQLLAEIEARTGIAVQRLPMLEEYRVDLGFELQWA